MKKKCIIALLLSYLISFQTLGQDIKAYFNADCEKALIDEISKSKKSIKIAIYSFTRFNIANSLSRAAKRGVDVKIIWDKSQLDASEYGPKILQIVQKNKIEVVLVEKKSKMHHKFAVIDKETVVTGSFNFTTSASKYNDENMIIFKDAKTAEKFLKAWEEIFLKNKK